MHQSFVSTAPLGSGNSGVFNFSVFQARLKALHCGVRSMVKSLLNAPAPRSRSNEKNIAWNTSIGINMREGFEFLHVDVQAH